VTSRWAYAWFTTGKHQDVHTVLGWAMEFGNHYGADGWELINFELRDSEDEVYIAGMMKRPSYELPLSAPGNKHVGTLIQTSPIAPGGITYQSPDMPYPVPWERYIDDDGLFRVKAGPLGDQYVYDDAQVLKNQLNAVAPDPPEMRRTHDLKYWSGVKY
jgi:hypothetical protein